MWNKKVKPLKNLALLLLLIYGCSGGGGGNVIVQEPIPQTIVFYGTSLTALGGDWVTQVSEKLPSDKFIVANEGIRGATSYDGLASIHRVIGHSPSLVFIEFGMNDSGDNIIITPVQFMNNLTEMVTTIMHMRPGAAIVLLTMNPVVPGSYRAAHSDVETYYDVVRDVARAQNVDLLDLYQNWAKLTQEQLEECIPDDVHPTYDAAKTYIVDDVFNYIMRWSKINNKH